MKDFHVYTQFNTLVKLTTVKTRNNLHLVVWIINTTVKPRTLKAQTSIPQKRAVWYLQENVNKGMMGKKGSN